MIYDSPDTDVAEPPEQALFSSGEEPPHSPPSQPSTVGRAVAGWFTSVAAGIKGDPLQAGLVVVPVVVFVVGAWVHRFVNEDGFINFHVVQQITAGNGPVFNPGERVEAYTSPLFILVLTMGRVLFGWAVSLPRFAVGVGIVLSTAALMLGMATARRVASFAPGRTPSERGLGPARDARPRSDAVLVPVGALLVACTPPMWRWATSGLESSLSFCWIALCSWGLVRRYDGDRGHAPSFADRPRWLLVVIGLGMLVRPEFVLFTLCFLVALYLTSEPSWRAGLRGLAWAAGVPVLYQIFRMGYFASLVPNTAIAKGSDATHLDWGFEYAKQFLGISWMWIALVAVVALVAVTAQRAYRFEPRAMVVTLAPVAGVVLHVLYVQKVGGDYMYARFYIPSFFALAVPVMLVPFPRRGPGAPWRSPAVIVSLSASLVILAWSVAAVVNGKILDANTGLGFGDYGMLLPGATNPVEPDDYGFMVISVNDILAKAGAQPNVLIDSTDANHKPIPLGQGQGIVVKSGAVGVTSYVAGPDMWIVDDRGLADPYAARLFPNTAYGYAGHEKLMSWEWVVARWAGPRADEGPKVAYIRKVLQCPDIKELNDATTDPMTPARFLKNIAASRKLSSLKLFDDPVDTEKWVCGTGR